MISTTIQSSSLLEEAQSAMMSWHLENSGLPSREEEIMIAAQSLKAMAHPLRLKILCVLGEKELSVQEIVDQVGTTQSNISQHLAILKENDILVHHKDANRVYYRVGDPRVLRLIRLMREIFCDQLVMRHPV